MKPNERVREYRLRKKYTVRRFAEIIGMSHGNLSNIEMGRVKITPAVAKKFAATMKCKPQALIDWGDNA